MEFKQLDELCKGAIKVIRQTGEFLKEEFGKVGSDEIETKSLNSLVSYVDKTSEKRLVEGLSALLPESVFLTEEETVQQETGELVWIIDPLDGTTNFLHRIPVFAISVALQEKGETILGIVLEVMGEECYHAVKGGGAFLNDKKIKVSSSSEIGNCLIATGFPYYDFSKESSYFEAFHYFMHHTRGLRRLGAAAVDLAYVASGRFDLYFEYSLQAWDLAAGAFLVQEAGGKVSDFEGGSSYLKEGEIIAGNAAIFDHSFPIIHKAFCGD
jgi:myo-inositol-1(or 4)-monophosphatase